MVSRTETDEGIAGQDSQLAATSVALKQHSRFDQNYGAMTVIMGYLPRIEQLGLQRLDKWQYTIGVSRVQVRFEGGEKMLYFSIQGQPQIMAVSETGECKRFEYRGEEKDFMKFYGWQTCQVGQSHLYQLSTDGQKIIIHKIDQSEGSFTIEREQKGPNVKFPEILTNFKDQFIFCCSEKNHFRYSLAQEGWEELPPTQSRVLFEAACSLGDKVYVFCGDEGKMKKEIDVLHNPGASLSSQDPPRWQVIDVPRDVVSFRYHVAFAPLNSTEIAILGGKDENGFLNEVITFDTSSNQFKRETKKGAFIFFSLTNQSAQVRKNTIVALMRSCGKICLIKYTKGDTNVTKIPI